MLEKTIDIELIHNLDKACFDNKAYSLSTLDKMLFNNDFYLIKSNEINVGFLIIQTTGSDLEIIKIGILEQYRQQNFASQTIEYIKNNFNYEKLLLEVSDKNLPAINLYKKMNFKCIHTRKKYYQDGSDAIIMVFVKY